MLAEYDIVLTTPQLLQPRDEDVLTCVHWWRVIQDESHQAGAVSTSRRLQARAVWGMTGTPFKMKAPSFAGLEDMRLPHYVCVLLALLA